jgi:maltose O-acetyltransferase
VAVREPRPWHHRGPRESVSIEGNVNIDPAAVVWSHEARSSFVTLSGGRIIIGRGTFVNSGAWMRSKKLIRIGANCQIGPCVTIYDFDGHEIDGPHVPGGDVAAVVVADGAWLGARAIVLKGVFVGKGAIVGAGAVVTRDVPEWTLVAGNPARHVRDIKRPSS